MAHIPLPTPADSIDGLVTPSAALARSYVGWRVDGFLFEWEKAEGFEKWLAFWLATQAMIQTFSWCSSTPCSSGPRAGATT